MNIYNGPFLNIKIETDNNRLINLWKFSPNTFEEFKSELINYRIAVEKANPSQVIWLQQNFTFNVDDDAKLWVEENILKPRSNSGVTQIDKNGYHPVAFVVGRDVLSHMEVIGVFEKSVSKAFRPKHFATEEEARNWLDNDFFDLPNKIENPKIFYKGLDDNGKAIIEFKSSPEDITNMIKSFKTMLKENEFIKMHLNEFTTLSKREIEVLTHISNGEKHQKVAETLFISIHTVRKHIKNIKSKLNIKSKKELLNYFNAFIKK